MSELRDFTTKYDARNKTLEGIIKKNDNDITEIIAYSKGQGQEISRQHRSIVSINERTIAMSEKTLRLLKKWIYNPKKWICNQRKWMRCN